MACKGCTELIDMTPNFLNDCGPINLRNAVAQHLIYLLHLVHTRHARHARPSSFLPRVEIFKTRIAIQRSSCCQPINPHWSVTLARPSRPCSVLLHEIQRMKAMILMCWSVLMVRRRRRSISGFCFTLKPPANVAFTRSRQRLSEKRFGLVQSAMLCMFANQWGSDPNYSQLLKIDEPQNFKTSAVRSVDVLPRAINNLSRLHCPCEPRCAQPVVCFSIKLNSSYITIAIAPTTIRPANAKPICIAEPAEISK